MSQYTVTFCPENIQTVAEEGDNLLDLAKQADIQLTSSCGGNGMCGKCKVIIRKGDVHTEQTSFIDQRERELGYVLACLTVVQSDLEVEIPPGSRLEDEQILAGEVELEIEKWEGEAAQSSAMTTKLHLPLPEPSLEDSVDDLGRIFREIKKTRQIDTMQSGLVNLKYLGGFLRQSNWDVTALLGLRGGTIEMILLEPGDTSGKNYGIAVDIGTTTVAAHLINLATRKTIGATARANSQGSFGDDVISRIVYSSRDNGLETLHRTIVGDINNLIVYLTRRYQVDLNDVTCVMCAGNTTMTHFALGVDPTYIRREPYVSTANFFPVVRAAEAGIRINRRGLLSCMPGVASYVGGDITAGALASGISESEDICLFIDIGTNGEMVLGNEEWLVCCSCSCGPAFEGGGARHGMRAARGAIQRVTIDESYDVSFSTIGNGRATGICGSGFIDVLSEMLRAGVIDRACDIQTDLDTPRVREGDEGWEFVLAWKEEAAARRGDITISQADIDNLIRSKAAVYAAAKVLLEKMDITWDKVERLYVAGGFGNYLNIEKSIFIGLLPDLPLSKFRFIGNSSITGAKLAMLSSAALKEAEEIANKMTYIELSGDNTFFEQFTAATFLPHTDIELFPSVAKELVTDN
ncbi:ASKHA domain-containing protein [Candidatus Poribacteria bacterium]